MTLAAVCQGKIRRNRPWPGSRYGAAKLNAEQLNALIAVTRQLHQKNEMSQSLTNPLFVPPGTTFPLYGTENMIILQGEFFTQARIDDIIRAIVTNVSILAPVNVTSGSYTLTGVGVTMIFVNFNGAVSIVLNPLFIVAGQEILIADRGGFASDARPIIITSTGAPTFDGDTSMVLNSPYGRVRLVYDGTNYAVV